MDAGSEERLDVGRGQRDRGHGTGAGQPGDRPGPEDDDLDGVVEGERAGRVGGGDLALGVPDDGVGGDAMVLPELGKAGHDGEQHRLDDVVPVEQIRVRVGEQVGQVPVDVPGAGVGAGGDVVGEHGLVGQQVPSHRRPLGALPGEDEHGPAAERGTGDQIGVGVSGGERRQGAEPVSAADHHGPPRERRPGGRQRVGHVRRVELGMPGQVLVQPAGLPAQRRLGPCRHDPRRVHAGDLPDRAVRRLLEDHVGVGTAHPEGRDAGAEPALGPRTQRGLDPEVQPFEVDIGVGGDEVEAGRELPVLHGQRDLQQTDDAGRALEVADVRLGGADQQRRSGWAGPAERRTQRVRLDRVADRGSGTVQFDVLQLGRCHPGVLARPAEHLLLRGGAGHGEPAGGAVVVHGAAAEQAVDVVAVGQRAAQRLEHDGAATLATHVAVRAGVERVADAVRGQRAEPGEVQRALRREDEVHATSDRQFGLAAPDALGGHVHGDQRRRLGGVDGQAGSVQPETVGDAVGDDAAGQTGDSMWGDRVGAALVQQRRVVTGDRADEDPGVAAVQ